MLGQSLQATRISKTRTSAFGGLAWAQPPGPQGAVLGHANGGPQQQAATVHAGRPEVQHRVKDVEVADVLQQAAVQVAEDVDGRGHADVQAHEGQGHHHRLAQPHPAGRG